MPPAGDKKRKEPPVPAPKIEEPVPPPAEVPEPELGELAGDADARRGTEDPALIEDVIRKLEQRAAHAIRELEKRVEAVERQAADLAERHVSAVPEALVGRVEAVEARLEGVKAGVERAINTKL